MLVAPSSLNQDHVAGGASRLAALLIAHLCPISSLFAPRHPGEAEFFRRLRRARHQKAQYLVIQAGTLVSTRRPDLASTALNLIALVVEEHYEPFHASGAFLTKAHALLLLDCCEEAFQAFEDALAARRAVPYVVNNTWLEYP